MDTVVTITLITLMLSYWALLNYAVRYFVQSETGGSSRLWPE